MRYEIGTHYRALTINCLACAIRQYEALKELKYLKDTYKNKILMNTYGWKNDI